MMSKIDDAKEEYDANVILCQRKYESKIASYKFSLVESFMDIDYDKYEKYAYEEYLVDLDNAWLYYQDKIAKIQESGDYGD